MEQFLLKRLELRRKVLREHMAGAEEILKQCRQGTEVNHHDLVKWDISLKQSISNVQNDIDQYVAKNYTETTLLDELLQDQMKGEKLLIDLDLIIDLYSNTVSAKKQHLSNPMSVKLPKIELAKFNGDILRWTMFWDRFEANVHSQNLKDVEKLAYLFSSLEGTAKEAVEGLSITNDNYKVAIETLKARYGDVNKVIDSHYEALSKLTRCNYTPESCRRTLNEIERHLRVLTSLGESEGNNHLRTLITGKFPDRVLYEVNLLTANDQTVASIRSTLDTVISAMERSQVQSEEPLPSTSTEAFHTHARKPVYFKGKKVSKKFTDMGKVKTPARTCFKRKGHTDTLSNLSIKRTKYSCIFCEGPHYNDECKTVPNLEERRKKLKNRCFKCLKEGHRAIDCKWPKKCYHCKGNHNRALCPKGNPPGKNDTDLNPTINALGRRLKSKSFLQTATAQVVHNNKAQHCRILLDCGSQRSYITTGLAQHLNMTPKDKELLLIFTFGAEKPTETLSPCSDIVIRTKRGIEKNLHVNIVPHITDRIPEPNIPKTEQVDVLADSGSNGYQAIDMLIGNDYYFSFIRNDTIQIDTDLFLVDTDFGWVVSGHLDVSDTEKEDKLSVITYHQSSGECTCYTQPDLPLRDSDLKFLWSLENIGITDSVKATREEEAVHAFNESVIYNDGRYYVKWPWTEYPPQLPTNYGLAYGRLKGLLQRLDESTLQEYEDIIQEQLKAGIIEIVEPKEVHCQSVPPVHYLSHHIVKQRDKRGRVVYDASARLKDQKSLNECMYKGPCMLQDLTALLLNFRMNQIGVIADVEKAFLQVGLQEEDREVTRFLWVKDINKPLSNNNILHFRFCRVPFGVISSPFLLTATIRHHISNKDSSLLKNIANKCYVDNVVTGARTTEEAVKLFNETRSTFEELSMNLRDWTSNDKDFMQKIPEQYRSKDTDETKVLGLLWNKTKDRLTLNVNKETLIESEVEKCTKREALRTLASVYDPCGMVSPVLLPIKLFLQDLWKRNYKWDQTLPQELILKWRTILSNLQAIKNVHIPRYVGTTVNGKITNELHCFTDASKEAYAAVVYLRSDNGYNANTEFLISKSRVVPLEREKKTENKDGNKRESTTSKKKSLTIPQLELLGCVIGNRLLTYLTGIIELPITRQYLWTDSLVALSWIHSNKLLTPFVANRVEEIKRNSGIETRYINTKENPADIATRPELWIQKKGLWFKGPNFLSKNKDQWPKNMNNHQIKALTSAVAEGLDEQLPDLSNTKSVRAENSRTIQSHVDSQVMEIRRLQLEYFPEECKGKETNLTRNLGLYTDVDGLLRCKGRMMHAYWSYDMRYPILLHRDSDFTKKVIKETHEENYHVGPPHTLNLVRQRFWVPKGRPLVEKIIKKCPQCVKHGGGPYTLPPTPALPVERANYSTPFTYTGIDYFGPMYVETEEGPKKRWVCLLTCLAVRAIHLEIVRNLTADECMMALRRFISSRNIPALIMSDNAMYFKLCSEVLNSEYCIKNQIKWKFIAQLAPWHGACYERLIGLVKHCMKRTLEKRLLNDTQALTVIKEIEAVVNSRPLTRVYTDMEIVLRPSDFLSLGNCLNLEFSEDFGTEQAETVAKHSLIESWKRGQNMLNQFKTMFINQYLTSLRERYQHSYKQPRVKSHKEPRVGDIVQIKGEAKNRVNWKVGKIVNLIKSSDGHCRVAQVQVNDSIFTRSIAHLYPLELDEPLSQQPEVDKVKETSTGEQRPEEFEFDTTQVQELPGEIERGDDISGEPVVPEIVPIRDTEDGHEESSVSMEPGTSQPMQEQVDCAESLRPTETDMSEDIRTESESHSREEVVRRAAAIRAREKIAEWTRLLFTML